MTLDRGLGLLALALAVVGFIVGGSASAILLGAAMVLLVVWVIRNLPRLMSTDAGSGVPYPADFSGDAHHGGGGHGDIGGHGDFGGGGHFGGGDFGGGGGGHGGGH